MDTAASPLPRLLENDLRTMWNAAASELDPAGPRLHVHGV